VTIGQATPEIGGGINKLPQQNVLAVSTGGHKHIVWIYFTVYITSGAVHCEMTEEISTTSEMSVAVAATGMTQVTGGSSMTSSPASRSSYVYFYFQCAVLIIGVVGTATNALIIYAMVASKQHKKQVLIVNQNALDLFSSFFLAITYSLKLCNIQLTGSTGYWLCTLLLSENLTWCGFVGSSINLSIISVERYLKIVHRTWSKKHIRKWMIYSAAAFAWIGSLIYSLALVFSTTKVIAGVCYPYAFWANKMALVAHMIWSIVSFYGTTLLLFIFCYWRILAVIRHQASVMAGHGTSGGSSYNRIQASVIKTMVLVSLLYAISFMPNYVGGLLQYLFPNLPIRDTGYHYASVFMIFLYVCANPFIYATKLDPVKEVLLRMIPCKKISEQATENVATGPSGNAT